MAAASGVLITNKSVQVTDIPRFISLWNVDSLVPTCDVRKNSPEGVAYNLTLYDPLQRLSRKLYVKIPADKKGALQMRTGEYGAYFFITDQALKQQMDDISTPFAEAMQLKCGNRGEEPDVIFPEFYRWPWKSEAREFMSELYAQPDNEVVLLLNGAYHNTKEGKNVVTLEWVVSQHVSKPLVPRIRKGKKRAAESEEPAVEQEASA